jgi:DNA-binding SARP family transcriptional activator
VERHRGDWWEHTTGTDFLANAADICRRVGLLTEATEYLARADGRVEGTVATLEFSRAARQAFDGDAVMGAESLAALRAGGRLHRVDVPRALLLQAYAHRRMGRSDADGLAERALREARVLGVEEAIAGYEPEVRAALGLGSGARDLLRIQLLGRFEARLGDRHVDVSPGMGSTLVKQLALTGTPLTLDQVLESLWPHVEPNTARRRLRNLLNRLREVCGDLVVRTASGLALLPGTSTDVQAFAGAVDQALHATDDVAVARCHDAAALYTGELLPEDRYEDWCAAERERLARLYVRVLDRAARLLRATGEHERALADLDKAIAAEPTDPYRYLDAAEAASAAGRRDSAAHYVDAATAMLAELALRPDEAFRRRVAALGFPATSGSPG